jgi:hypothetical protein
MQPLNFVKTGKPDIAVKWLRLVVPVVVALTLEVQAQR